MVKHKHDVSAEDGAIMNKFHYKQELNRTLKFFGSFATAFSAISITTGIFLNFGFVLTTAGTAGIWTWPIVTIGQLLIALIFAEISGFIPISGYSYQWVKRLANPGMGWFAGWISFCFLFIVTPSIDAAVAPVLAELLGIQATATNLMLIVMATLTLQMIINILSVRLATMINNAAVYTETFGIIGLTIALLIIAFVNGAPASNLVDTNNAAAANGGSYLLPFAMASLIGLYTLVGFEVPANLSEETKDAHKTVPKAVIFSVVVSGIFGTLFLIALALGIKDMGATVAADSPILLILEQNMGEVIAKIFMVVIVISIFACGLVCSTSATRIVYAMARDKAFFASKLFKKVNEKTKTPIPACILMWVLGMLSIYFAGSITVLAVAASVLPATYYLITVVSYVRVRKKVKFREGCFKMGKKVAPVVFVLAILWLLFGIGILTIPKDFHEATLVNGAIVVIGIILYFAYFKNAYAKKAAEEIKNEESIFIEEASAVNAEKSVDA